MFLLNKSLDLSEIGYYPQVQGMTSTYPNYAECSIQRINIDTELDYTPLLDSFMVSHKAKLTDCLVIESYLLISEKLLKILINSDIENYQFFDASVIHRKKQFKYYFFFIYGQKYDLIDYKNMTFWGESQPPYSGRLGTFDLSKIEKKEIKVERAEQIINWQNLYPDYPNRHYEVLKLNHNNIHSDMIRTPNQLGNYYMVSENLRDKIIEHQCTGISFRTKDWQERPIL